MAFLPQPSVTLTNPFFISASPPQFCSFGFGMMVETVTRANVFSKVRPNHSFQKYLGVYYVSVSILSTREDIIVATINKALRKRQSVVEDRIKASSLRSRVLKWAIEVITGATGSVSRVT